MSTPLRALLVDDEPPALQRLHQLLLEHGGVEVVAEARSVAEASGLLEEQSVDLVFLDLRMPGGDGSSLLPHLNDAVEVIFTTAHSEYAVSAFEAGAHDYLLKPFNRSRLALSLERLKQRRGRLNPATSDGFWVDDSDRADGSRLYVVFRDVAWVAAMQNYTHLQLVSGPPLVLKRTMRQWEDLLPVRHFLRLDRSTIVHTARIQRCERQSRTCTILRFGTDAAAPTLAVGATGAARLQQALAAGPGEA